MKFKLSLVAVAAATSFSQGGFAQSSTSKSDTKASETSVKIEDAVQKDRAAKDAKGQDTDQLITNRMERARTGSKSKGLSGSFNLNYLAGSIERPLDRDRPNILAGAGVPTAPTLSGSLGVRYRIDTQSNLNLSAGIQSRRPFHDSLTSLDSRTSIRNVGLTYTYINRLGSLQSVTRAIGGVGIDDASQILGYVGGVSLGQTLLSDLGGSRLTLGLSASVGYSYFNKDPNQVARGADVQRVFGRPSMLLGLQQSDIDWGVYPFMEYVLTDKLNWRLLTGQFFQHQRILGDHMRFAAARLYVSTGIGIAVTRDIFLYPNVQFVPENPRSDLTNIAISADINVF